MKKYNVTTLEDVKKLHNPVYETPDYRLPCGMEPATYWDDGDGTEYAECSDGHAYRLGEQVNGLPNRWYWYEKTPIDNLDDMIGKGAVWYRGGLGGLAVYLPVVVAGWHKSQAGNVWVDVKTTDGHVHHVKPHNIANTHEARRWAESAAVEAELLAQA